MENNLKHIKSGLVRLIIEHYFTQKQFDFFDKDSTLKELQKELEYLNFKTHLTIDGDVYGSCFIDMENESPIVLDFTVCKTGEINN